MARYFNKGRGNLPLTLAGGKSVSVPGSSWIELVGKEETTASVRRAVKKGQLIRKSDNKNTTTVEVKIPPAPTVSEREEAAAGPAPVLAEASTSGSGDDLESLPS